MRSLPGSRMDAVVFKRETSDTDSDGNYQGTVTTLGTLRGTWQILKGRYGAEQQSDDAGRPQPAKRTAYLDCRTALPVKVGDWCEVLGVEWGVVGVSPDRWNTRFILESPRPEPFA